LRRFKKRFVVRAEVRHVERVKVACRVQKEFPVKEFVTIKVRNYRSETKHKMIDEPHTVYRTERKKRPKTTWKKEFEAVQEMVDVEVVKKHRVRRPITRLVEKEELVDAQVIGSKPVTVDAYRIDEVQGIKLVEIEVEEDFELLEQPKGRRRKTEGRDINLYEGRARRIGTKIYPTDAKELKGLEEEECEEGQISTVLDRTITDYGPEQFLGHDEIRGPLYLSEVDVGVEEYFAVRNRHAQPLPLYGWTVHDSHPRHSHNVFRFPQGLVLQSKQEIKVYSGSRANEHPRDEGSLVWSTQRIWGSVNRAYLCDPNGDIVHILALIDLNDSKLKAEMAEFEIERFAQSAKVEEIRDYR